MANGLFDAGVAALFERAHEESAIEQMEHSVLNAANIVCYWQQCVCFGAGKSTLTIARVAKTRKIPRGLKKCVQRVGLALRSLAAARARDSFPFFVML